MDYFAGGGGERGRIMERFAVGYWIGDVGYWKFLVQHPQSNIPFYYAKYFPTIGIRRPIPKDFVETRSTGAV